MEHLFANLKDEEMVDKKLALGQVRVFLEQTKGDRFLIRARQIGALETLYSLQPHHVEEVSELLFLLTSNSHNVEWMSQNGILKQSALLYCRSKSPDTRRYEQRVRSWHEMLLFVLKQLFVSRISQRLRTRRCQV